MIITILKTSVVPLLILASFAVTAAPWNEEAKVIIAEAHKAHVDGYLSPTCDEIATYGENIIQDIEAANQFFTEALALRALGRREYYLGLISMARKGATAEDYKTVSGQCWRTLPQSNENPAQTMLGMLGWRR